MRLIDADKLSEQHEASMGELLKSTNCENISIEALSLLCGAKLIADAPTVDAVPVVHARWIEPVPGDGFPYCGNCKKLALDKGLFLNPKLMDWYKTKYCPNCGAKMDLEEQKCTSTDTEP